MASQSIAGSYSPRKYDVRVHLHSVFDHDAVGRGLESLPRHIKNVKTDGGRSLADAPIQRVVLDIFMSQK